MVSAWDTHSSKVSESSGFQLRNSRCPNFPVSAGAELFAYPTLSSSSWSNFNFGEGTTFVLCFSWKKGFFASLLHICSEVCLILLLSVHTSSLLSRRETSSTTHVTMSSKTRVIGRGTDGDKWPPDTLYLIVFCLEELSPGSWLLVLVRDWLGSIGIRMRVVQGS